VKTVYTDLSTGGYYFTPPSSVDTYTCAGGVSGSCKGSANPRQSETLYAGYDTYGNVLTEAQFGDIVGLASSSEESPLKQDFTDYPKDSPEFNAFGGKQKYSDWQFDYRQITASGPAPLPGQPPVSMPAR